jgi:ribosomal protein S18 acetylase RimI-like enzyme
MDDRELYTLVHRNLMTVSSWMGEAPGGAVDRRDGELLFAGSSPLPFLNGVMRESTEGDPAALLARAREFFFSRDRGFVVFTHPADPELDEAAREAGMFAVMDRYPEMVCRAPLPTLDADLRTVTTLDDAAAYWRVCDAAYPSLGFPPGVFDVAFTPESLLDGERITACLALVDGDPAAGACLCDADGVGMVGWVATLPEMRGRGLAAACTVWATNTAFERGRAVASLQASVMGEDIYRRLGYEELFSYRLYGAMP